MATNYVTNDYYQTCFVLHAALLFHLAIPYIEDQDAFFNQSLLSFSTRNTFHPIVNTIFMVVTLI